MDAPASSRPDVGTSPFAAIRKAGPDDVSRLVEAYAWLFAAPGSRPPRWDEALAARRLRNAVSDERTAILVAVSGAQLVGFCTVYRDIESVRFGPRAWVEDLAVDPAFRSRGVGKQLLDAAKEWARSQGAWRLALDSGDARLDAHRFYERERPSYRSRSFGWWLS